MFLQVKKLWTLMKVIKSINISYDLETDVYKIQSDSNILIQSNQNIAFVSNEDAFIISRSLHLNPKLDVIQNQQCLKELHGN